jgi:hypothetical protein
MQKDEHLTNVIGTVFRDHTCVYVFAQNREDLEKLIPEVSIPGNISLQELAYEGYTHEGTTYFVVLPDTPAFEAIELLLGISEHDPMTLPALRNMFLVEYRNHR